MKRLLVIGVIVIVAVVVCLALKSGGRMHPDQIAAAEAHMWRAYYAGDLPGLQRELIATLRAQFGISQADAESIGRSLGFAAMKFEMSAGNYEATALPDLEAAYRQLALVLKRPFDPRQAARAELAWWVTRRDRSVDTTPVVGQQIAALYAVIYGTARPEFAEAGRLRAEAAALRDRSGVNADWGKIETLLQASYRILAAAVK